jgi:hypothetical protein
MSRYTDRELQIQRLVDGEMTRSQTRQLLQSAELEPGLYRELAIAFAEDRILASETKRFTRVASGRSDWGVEPLEDPEEIAGEASTKTSALLNRAAGQHGGPSAWRNAGLWLAAAAMLLCAAGLGFLAGRDGKPTSPSDLLAGKAGLPSATAVRESGSYTFQLVDNQGQPIPNASLPLLTEEAAAQLGYNPSRAAIPPALQSEFRRAGYELKPEIKFIEGRLNDGRRVTLPYSDLKIRSYGQ